MFLRRNRRSRNGETYEYWSLMRTIRTAKGARHELVANLGKVPGLDPETRHGWEHIAGLLDGSCPGNAQAQFGQPLPTATPPPRWAQVDVSALRVERVRELRRGLSRPGPVATARPAHPLA